MLRKRPHPDKGQTNGSAVLLDNKDEMSNDNDIKMDDDEDLSEDFSEEEEEEDEEGADNNELEESEGGNVMGDTGEPIHKKTKLSKTALYRPPTNEEMRQLKETENLFHSSLFRMQIDEMLKEVQLKAARRKQMDSAVRILTDVLLSLTAGVNHDLSDESWLKRCKIPLSLKSVPNGNFQFLPPKKVAVTGSFLTNLCIKPDVHVDVTVEMPQTGFNKQDYMNHRYLRKRALYLCALAMKLRKHEAIENLHFSYHHGNHLRPLLTVAVKVEGHKAVKVNLHPIPEEGILSLRRFHICQNNIRPNWVGGKKSVKEEKEQDLPPTPLYNSLILQDLTLQRNVEYIQRAQEDCLALKAGIALLKVWLRQRQLDNGFGCFGSFIMTMFVMYLLSKRKLNRQMSSYQVMRNTLLELSRTDWRQDDLTLCNDKADTRRPELSEFRDKYPLVFVDVTGYHNLCASLDTSVYNRVKHEAEISMEILERRSVNSFEMLFMKKVTFSQKFDHLIHIQNTTELGASLEKVGTKMHQAELGGHELYTCIPGFITLLENGLGKRVKLIQVRLEPHKKWSINEVAPGHDQPQRITIGLLLNEEFAFNIMDRGPSADSPEAEDFRKFWGDKSELRRFKDGGICEAVLWTDETTVCRKRLICSVIVKYLLTTHAAVPSQAVQYVAGQFDRLLRLNVSSLSKEDLPYGTGEEESVDVMNAFERLRKIVRNVAGLPLKINTIQGVSPAFRYTEVFTPLPVKPSGDMIEISYVPRVDKPANPFCPALEVVCLLENSGKWPDDFEAMRRLKAALYLHLASTLESEYSLVTHPTADRLDILVEGLVFRLILACMKEVSVLRTIKEENGMIRTDVHSEKAASLEKKIFSLPKLSTTLLSIQQHNESYSCAVRLAKRWVTAQMLGDHIDEVAVELMVASLYVCPYPYTVPGSTVNGFLRFLHLLATFDWKNSPLMINLNDEFTVEDWSEIPQAFIKQRSTLPLMFISTPQDKYSSHWTKRSPTAPILSRLVLLAQRAILEVEQQILHSESPSLKVIFRPPLEIYDTLIYLKVSALSRKHEAVDTTRLLPKPSSKTDTKFPVVNFDPAQLYLKELRETLGEHALFFYDKHGGGVIGLLWKPTTKDVRDFKVSYINGTMPTITNGKDPKLTLNMAALLETVEVLGAGLVDRLQNKEKN